MEAFVRETKRRVLSLSHHFMAVAQRKRVDEILASYRPEVVCNTQPKEVNSIVFVITRMVRFHGGQTSVLRLGTQLARLGHQVSYAVYKNQSTDEMEICARSNLSNYEGTLINSREFAKRKESPDIIVATSWDTVSFVKRFTSYKMYFVQDYEPYFYPFGELFFLAKKSYEQGLHMVSLGDWNRAMILKECSPVSAVDVIDFPYEKSEYPIVSRNYEEYPSKKTITIAVYLKYYGKRLPCIIPYLLNEVAKQFLIRDKITLEIRYFGEAKSFSTKGGKNLGMLTKKELYALYAKSDFGMVASMSNISLTPYEMISTGLPLIEFVDGTFSYFFPKDSATLIEMTPKDLYQKLKKAIMTPELLKKHQENAMEYMSHLSWERTGRQFHELLNKIKNEG